MRLFLPLLLAGCNDYVLRGERKVEEPAVTDTAPPDTGEPAPATEPIYLNTSTELWSWDPLRRRTRGRGRLPHRPGRGGHRRDRRGHRPGGAAVRRLLPVPLPGGRRDRRGLAGGHPALRADGAHLPRRRTPGRGRRRHLRHRPRRARPDHTVDAGFYETSGDIVGLPDGLLYWTVLGDDLLVVVDPDTGGVAVRGDIGVEDVFGLGFAQDDLYGFTQEGPALRINAALGTVEETLDLAGRWYGATTNPVTW